MKGNPHEVLVTEKNWNKYVKFPEVVILKGDFLCVEPSSETDSIIECPSFTLISTGTLWLCPARQYTFLHNPEADRVQNRYYHSTKETCGWYYVATRSRELYPSKCIILATL